MAYCILFPFNALFELNQPLRSLTQQPLVTRKPKQIGRVRRQQSYTDSNSALKSLQHLLQVGSRCQMLSGLESDENSSFYLA